MDDAKEEYLSVSDAASYLGVSRVKVSKLVRDGVTPYVVSKLDGRVKLINRRHLDELRTAPRRGPVPR